MTDERERSDAGREPERVKVTDRRRFAGAEGAEEAPSAPPVPDEVALVKAQAEEYLGHLQRLQAEFDNFRKRAIKEQTRSVELASRPVMERLIEVLDDFEMALTPARNEEAPADGFRKGMELLYAKLLDALRAEVVAYRAASLAADRTVTLVWGRAVDQVATDVPEGLPQ